MGPTNPCTVTVAPHSVSWAAGARRPPTGLRWAGGPGLFGWGPGSGSSGSVLAHEGYNAGRWPRLGEERVLQQLSSSGPLGRVPHQQAVQEAFQRWRGLEEQRSGPGLLATGPLSCHALWAEGASGVTTGPQGAWHLRLISSPLLWSGLAGIGPFPRANPQQDGPTVRQPGPELCGSLGPRGPRGSVSGVGGGTRRHLRHSLALFTLCRFFSRGGRLSRIIFMALRGGSLK